MAGLNPARMTPMAWGSSAPCSDYWDPEGWLAVLADYEANSFLPLQRTLQSGRIACLEIRAGADSIMLGKYVHWNR